MSESYPPHQGPERRLDDGNADVCLSYLLSVELSNEGDEPIAIATDFVYDRQDPYAVRTVFHDGQESKTWRFGRELLSLGLYQPTGEGDVTVRPAIGEDGRACVVIELDNPDSLIEPAVLWAYSHEIAEFVQATYRVVPEDEEHQYTIFDKLTVDDFESNPALRY